MIDFKNGSIIKLNVTNETGPAQDVQPLLVKNETIIRTYKSVRDYVMFTNKRIIAVNVQGITGKKKDFTSLPYSRIQVFSIETSGHFDLDSELELYFSSIGKIKFEFVGNCNIADIGKIIGTFIL
ncbi:MAG: PH domain-containing protein [Lachnospiraceae bacterium]|nr:PH domain-containing protein [Lachnospiraceae bacterium]